MIGRHVPLVRSTPLALGLVGFQVLDGLVNAVPNDWVKEDLEHLRLPARSGPVFGAIKGASAAGLLLGLRRPAVGQLTARALVVYFVCALGAHARVKDPPLRYGPAVAMLAWSALATRCYS
jgi:DoxX-like family